MESAEKKQILIEIIDNEDGTETVSFNIAGISMTQALGLLRLYEQKVSIELLSNSEKW